MVKKTAPAGDSKAAAIAKVFDLIQEHSVELVDLRFTDPKGKWHHTCQYVSTIEEDSFTDGFMFDGSSIGGWKAINESDMVLLPDPTSAVMDPFSARPQLILFCDIIEPSTGQPYNRDPRLALGLVAYGIRQEAERLRAEYASSTGASKPGIRRL